MTEQTPPGGLKAECEKTLSTPRRNYWLPARLLFLSFDIFYGKKRTLPKFKVLELYARIPYQIWERAAYAAITRRYIDTELARRIFDYVLESRAQQDNEQWHLLMIEELIQKKKIKESFLFHRLVPQIVAFLYYQQILLLYLVKPEWSYRLNADFEDHAEHEYMELVKENPDFAKEPHESRFKKEYGDYGTLADLFIRIGLDERNHKEESLARMRKQYPD